jgi:hypothetical protein
MRAVCSSARLVPSAPAGRTALALAALASALTLGSCGDTLQDKPIPHNQLENLIAEPYPVFWLGRSFHGYQITEASQDPSGAATLQYGDCIEGGQSTCVVPVRVVTSPDNSFVPGTFSPHRTTSLRGVSAVIAESGRTIAFATGPVVVSIFAVSASLAKTASETAVPINEPGEPRAPLAAALPDTGFARKPLHSQLPSAPRPLRSPAQQRRR